MGLKIIGNLGLSTLLLTGCPGNKIDSTVMSTSGTVAVIVEE